MSLTQVLYRAQAQAFGGRDGHVAIPEAKLDLAVVTPKGLGGPGGDGTNPEQLFAAGYSACFLSALKVVAGREKVTLPADASVSGTVGIGMVGSAFGLEVDLEVSLPGVNPVTARTLVDAAHQVCPYSNATRGNVEVRITLS
jgi:osmotically inducible protein OsmC